VLGIESTQRRVQSNRAFSDEHVHYAERVCETALGELGERPITVSAARPVDSKWLDTREQALHLHRAPTTIHQFQDDQSR